MAQSKKGMVNRNMKKFLSVLCIAICLLGLTACEATKEVAPDDKEIVEQYSEFFVSYILAEDPDAYAYFFGENNKGLQTFDEEGAEYTEYVFGEMGLSVEGHGVLSGVESWNKAKAEAGALTKVGAATTKYSTKGDTLVVDVDVAFENRDAVIEFVYEDNLAKTLTSFAVNINYTFGEKMQKAGLNTVLGMGTVFIVLILLSLLISGFSFINKAENALKNKNKTEVKETPAPAAVSAVVEEVSDDSELVAVISAAIAAFEAASGGSADGYVVRSIRRRPSNKWNKN